MTTVIVAKLFPKVKPSSKHWYAYDVTLNGETIVADSRDPEHDLARALLARGIKGVAKVLDGVSGKHRSSVNIEIAAKYGVGRNLDRYVWKPPEIGNSSPPAGEADPARYTVRWQGSGRASPLVGTDATPEAVSMTQCRRFR